MMADHLEEPPQKRAKLQNSYQQGPSDSGECPLPHVEDLKFNSKFYRSPLQIYYPEVIFMA